MYRGWSPLSWAVNPRDPQEPFPLLAKACQMPLPDKEADTGRGPPFSLHPGTLLSSIQVEPLLLPLLVDFLSGLSRIEAGVSSSVGPSPCLFLLPLCVIYSFQPRGRFAVPLAHQAAPYSGPWHWLCPPPEPACLCSNVTFQ